MPDPVWEEKLSFLVEQDHTMREVLIKKNILSDTYHPEMGRLHLSNARKLSTLIKDMGFPVLNNAIHPPKDPVKKAQECEAWPRKVG